MPVNVFGGLWGEAELTTDHNPTAVNAETAVSMIFWGMAAGSMAAGWVSDRLGNRKWIVVSNAVLAAVFYSAAIYSDSVSPIFISTMLFMGGLMGGAQMLTFAMEGRSRKRRQRNCDRIHQHDWHRRSAYLPTTYRTYNRHDRRCVRYRSTNDPAQPAGQRDHGAGTH